MASKRFIRRGVAILKFSPTIANIHEVSRVEFDTAEDMTKEVADIAGWQLENTPVPVPDMASTFEKNIPGTDAAADSSLTIYDDLAGEEIQELQPKGTEGFILIARKGDIPGSASLGCFPVRVASKGDEFSASNDPARFVLMYSITDEPELDGPVPAAAVGG